MRGVISVVKLCIEVSIDKTLSSFTLQRLVTNTLA